jgi:hypothetical protein
MEISAPRPERRAHLVRKVRAHIGTMNRTAEHVTRGLGLPPEAKHDVLPVIYGETARDEQPSEPERPATDGERQ